MSNLVSQLAEHPFLEGFSDQQIGQLAAGARAVQIAEEEFVFKAHEPAEWFYLLVSGSVALKIHVPEVGPLPIQTIGPNDALGWSWLLPPYQWHFDARAIEPVRAIAFQAAWLREQMDRNRDLGYALQKRVIEILARRLQATRLQLLDVYQAK